MSTTRQVTGNAGNVAQMTSLIRKLSVTIAAGVMAISALPSVAAPTASTPKVTQVPAGLVGNDISWPNCPVGLGVPGRRSSNEPMPNDNARFVIIGLTNGRAFTRNPCIARHVKYVKDMRLRAAAYTMLSYPNRAERAAYGKKGPYDPRTYVNRIANVGYAQTAFALRTHREAGLSSPIIWVDVEPRAERPWSAKQARNRALIAGALRAIADAKLAAGIYTYAVAWRAIVGDWQVPEAPLWAPSHTRSRTYQAKKADAIASCRRDSFTGGPLVLTQWVHRRRDYDVTCPAVTTSRTTFFRDFARG